MRATAFALAGISALALTSAAQASSGRDVIAAFMDEGAALLAKLGYKPTDWSYRGQLEQNKEERITVKLTGGRSYELLGACDKDCQDLDLHLLDAGDGTIGQDEAQDNTPVVAVRQSGTYVVRVVMVKCRSAPCHYAVKAFAHS